MLPSIFGEQVRRSGDLRDTPLAAAITGYVQRPDDAAALERQHQIQDAVIRDIEVIGKAANRIQKQAPEFELVICSSSLVRRNEAYNDKKCRS